MICIENDTFFKRHVKYFSQELGANFPIKINNCNDVVAFHESLE